MGSTSPLLALHRFRAVTVTDVKFTYPRNYDFERSMNRHFGVICGKRFKVRAEFSGWAAGFVLERIWSPDQKITHRRDGKVVLSFSSTSEPEVLTWILAFGEEAKLLGPPALVQQLKERIAGLGEMYGG